MDVDQQFLQATLQFLLSDANFQVTKHTIQCCEELKNRTSEFLNVTAHYIIKEQENSLNVLVQRHNAENVDFDKKLFFVHFILLRELEASLKSSPSFDYITKCLFLKQNLCALENPLQNNYSFVKHWNIKHVKSVINALADWHVSSFILEKEHNSEHSTLKDDYKICLQENNCFSYNRILIQSVQALQVHFKSANPKENQDYKNIQRYLEVVLLELNSASCNNEKKVFCIGHVTNKNTLFQEDKYDENIMKCKFVDMQMLTLMPPMYDLMYLIYFNIPSSAILESKNKWVKYYIEQLTAECSKHGFQLSDFLSNSEIDSTVKKYTKFVKFIKLVVDIYKILQENNNACNIFGLDYHLLKLKYLLENDLMEYEELEKIAQEKLQVEHVEITDVTFSKLTFGKGFVGDHYFIHLKANANKTKHELNFFVKMYPTNEDLKWIVENNGAFLKESRLFNNIYSDFQRLNITLWEDFPTCYYANDMWLVFEDLKEQGYKNIESRIPLSLEYVQIVLDRIAKLHASGYVFEELYLKKNQKVIRLNELYAKEFAEALHFENDFNFNSMKAVQKSFSTLIKMFQEDLKGADVDTFTKWVLDKADGIYNWSKPSKKYKNTICHGDLWHNNILFQIENEKVVNCKLVDYQTFRYNTPGTEFISFMHWCTDRKFRIENDMSSFYYKKLKMYCGQYNVDIGKILPFCDFMDSVKLSEPFSVVQALMWAQVGKQTLTQLQDFKGEVIDYFVNVDRSRLVVQLCEQDPFYKELMRGYILEFERLYLESLK